MGIGYLCKVGQDECRGDGRADHRLDAFGGHALSGGESRSTYRDGHIREIAAYCESDVVNTYRVWLLMNSFVAAVGCQFQASDACLIDFMKARVKGRCVC